MPIPSSPQAVFGLRSRSLGEMASYGGYLTFRPPRGVKEKQFSSSGLPRPPSRYKDLVDETRVPALERCDEMREFSCSVSFGIVENSSRGSFKAEFAQDVGNLRICKF